MVKVKTMMNLNQIVDILDEEILLESEEHINTFLGFCKDKLEIGDDFNLNLKDDRDGLNTLANYNTEDKTINIYIKGRLTADILRSIAHELVHHKQRIDGKEMNGETGSAIEDEANARAGSLVREFGDEYPAIYESIK